MTWKRSLALNNDDGKKTVQNKEIYLQKKNKLKTSLPTQPSIFLLSPCNVPWNENQKKIKGNFFN